MLNTTVLLHANILYAEIPFAHIPQVVENSYLPVLETILACPQLKVVLDFSGFTLEVLNGEHPSLYKGKPEVISLLKQGLAGGQLELTGSSWSHAVLPLLPLPLMRSDIDLFCKTAKRILDYTPQGFFPPELGVSPLLPFVLKELGFKWSFFDKDFISFSEQGFLNAYNEFDPVPFLFTKETAHSKFAGLGRQLLHMQRMYKRLKNDIDFEPIHWRGTQDTDIIGIPCDGVWMTYALICLSHQVPVLSEKNLVKTIKRLTARYNGLFMPYSSDIEFYGYGGNTVKELVPVSRLKTLLDCLCETENIRLILPSEYLAAHPDVSSFKKYYLKAGTWSSDKNFDLWEREADNAILNERAREAYALYKQFAVEGQATLTTPQGTYLDQENVLRDVLLAFNSDGRGWTPLPEHRLFCFNKALSVKDQLSE